MLLKYRQKLSILAAAISALFAGPALAAGTIPLALSIQLDTDGTVAANCQATFYQAGTVATKQNIYSDFSLTQVMANPLSCDQSGRLPMFWIADGLIHVRLTNFSGNPIVDTTMQVLGPSSGGGGGGSTVDPTTIMATGDLKVKYGTGPLSGFVRANGLTIGNASSGASERANADTQALFVYLCGADVNLVMTPARSGNCLSDYNANKQLALPDWRGRAIAALDDMGNSVAGRLTAAYFGTAATVLGAAGGAQSHALAVAEIPTLTSAGTITVSPGAGVSLPGSTSGFSSTSYQPGAGTASVNSNGATVSNVTTLSGSNSVTTSGTGGATGNAHGIVPPMMLATIYLKL